MIRSSSEWSASKSSCTVVEGVFPDGDRHDVGQLMEVGGGGQRPLVGIEVLHDDLGGVGHQGAPPPSRPERTHRVTASRLEPSGMIGPWAERL
jgi:hypothetical protein